MKYFYSFLLVFLVDICVAQTSINVNLNHLYEGNPFALNQVIETPDYNFKITRFQYYLSNFSIIHDGGSETFIDDSYLLVDASNNDYVLNSVSGITDVEEIKFHYGVDEIANHDDPAQYDPSHALAYKTPSMHWGWSGGYMFAVVDGVVDDNKDGVFDIGFDFMPVADKYYTQLNLVCTDEILSNSLTLNIDVRIDKWLTEFDLSTVGINHGQNANLASFVNVDNRKVFNTDATVSIFDSNSNLNVFNVINNGLKPFILVNQVTKKYDLSLYDISGKYLAKILLDKDRIELSEYLGESGTFILSLQDKNNKVIQTQKILFNPQ